MSYVVPLRSVKGITADVGLRLAGSLHWRPLAVLNVTAHAAERVLADRVRKVGEVEVDDFVELVVRHVVGDFLGLDAFPPSMAQPGMQMAGACRPSSMPGLRRSRGGATSAPSSLSLLPHVIDCPHVSNQVETDDPSAIGRRGARLNRPCSARNSKQSSRTTRR
jgi:hypothetical protein